MEIKTLKVVYTALVGILSHTYPLADSGLLSLIRQIPASHLSAQFLKHFLPPQSFVHVAPLGWNAPLP